MNGQELTAPQRAQQVLGFDARRAELAELRGKSASITAITNADGREECHRALMVLRNARVSIEKIGKAAREDATAFSKSVIDHEKQLIAEISPEETRLAALRDGWDQAREREREEKVRAEQRRVEGIRARIEQLRNPPVTALSVSGDIASHLQLLQVTAIGEEFAEFAEQAQDARDGAVLRVQEMLRTAEAREQAAREEADRREQERQQIERDRRENERLRQELAEQKRQSDEARAELDRIAAEQREREAAEQRRKDEEAAAERRRKEEEAREQREAQERAQREEEARQAEERRKEQAAEDERLAAEAKRLTEEREAFEQRQRDAEEAARQKAIDEATVTEAARECLPLLQRTHPNHIATQKLIAALEREPLAAAA